MNNFFSFCSIEKYFSITGALVRTAQCVRHKYIFSRRLRIARLRLFQAVPGMCEVVPDTADLS